MDQTLHSEVKSAVSWVDSSRWKPAKATKDTNISRQGFGLRILRCARYLVHRYLEKGRIINSKYYKALLMCLKEEIAKKMSTNKEKSHLSPRQCIMSQVDHNDAKLHELHFELLLHPPYSPDLASSNYWLFTDLKRILQGKRFGSNKEVILETEAYFEAKNKSFYKKGIELLEKHWNQCITLWGDYVDEWRQILSKSCCFIS